TAAAMISIREKPLSLSWRGDATFISLVFARSSCISLYRVNHVEHRQIDREQNGCNRPRKPDRKRRLDRSDKDVRLPLDLALQMVADVARGAHESACLLADNNQL